MHTQFLKFCGRRLKRRVLYVVSAVDSGVWFNRDLDKWVRTADREWGYELQSWHDRHTAKSAIREARRLVSQTGSLAYITKHTYKGERRIVRDFIVGEVK